MITLTTEQAQQIEEALEDIVRVFKFETGTPVEALAAIRAARAQEQAEQDLDTCPGCGGVADNGHDREFPPNPYYCTKCSEQAEQEPVAEVVLRNQSVGFGRTEERKDIQFLADVDVGTKLYAKSQQQAEQELVSLNKKQDWANLSGEQAFHLIDRHAEGWEEIGAMMDAWLLAKQQTPREPVAEVFYETEYDESVSIKTNRKVILSYKSISELAVGTKLYAAPVQQVDLTGNEINRVWESVTNLPITTRETTFARAVIAAYKEKNKWK